MISQAPGGLSCFLIERGPGFELQRLKDKLGTRSLPSAEVELRGLPGRLVGEEGRGVAAIVEMVTTRGSTACWAARRECAGRWPRR